MKKSIFEASFDWFYVLFWILLTGKTSIFVRMIERWRAFFIAETNISDMTIRMGTDTNLFNFAIELLMVPFVRWLYFLSRLYHFPEFIQNYIRFIFITIAKTDVWSLTMLTQRLRFQFSMVKRWWYLEFVVLLLLSVIILLLLLIHWISRRLCIYSSLFLLLT